MPHTFYIKTELTPTFLHLERTLSLSYLFTLEISLTRHYGYVFKQLAQTRVDAFQLCSPTSMQRSAPALGVEAGEQTTT